MLFTEDKKIEHKEYKCLSGAGKACPYDTQASIFKHCTSVVQPVNREHVKALNMSVCVCVCVGLKGDADSGASLPPPHSKCHFRSHHCCCDPLPAATPYLTELLSKFALLYF